MAKCDIIKYGSFGYKFTRNFKFLLNECFFLYSLIFNWNFSSYKLILWNSVGILQGKKYGHPIIGV